MFHEKRWVKSIHHETLAVAELKIWSVPRSKDYSSGRKFSLFLVYEGDVAIGIDNHKPKGPHLHLGNKEIPYAFENEESLLKDFWDLVRKAGYLP